MSYLASANQNYVMNIPLLNKINQHLDQLFNRYSKLVLFRVDFSYCKNSERHEQQSDELLQREIKQLMEQVISTTLVVGYFWVIEKSNQHGLHVHAAFYLNGQVQRKVYPVAQEIGQLWSSATDNEGYYHYCQVKEHYKSSGERIIDYRHDRSETHYVLSYLAKEEQKNGTYIYGANQVSPHSGRGRPRNERT